MGKKTAAVLGAGSWGTVLATVLADNGFEVIMWARRESTVQEINEHHRNSRYIPDVHLPRSIRATTSIEGAIRDREMVLFVVPSQSMREVARAAAPHLRKDALIIHASKGFELDSLKRMSEVLKEELPTGLREKIAVLSGPSHAEEVAKKSPTTVVVSSERQQTAELAQSYLINPYFRVYTNPDMVGVEIGGSLKNIIALGAGLSDGLGFGDNAKAALVTRGLAEITRLGMAMGARPITFAGLAGVGDLVVTCTSRHSRNWRAGHMLSQGMSLDEVLERMGMVVEGVKTTRAAYRLAQQYQVEMPITNELHAVLFDRKDPRQAVEDLMCRGKTNEMEEIVQGW
ncbi:glycerol-3-phosphate dehydrogenase [NAD(P)+] [Polycladomyces abyssicola]|uniref:Glycerol-3-phosphate dehydrogenase [NAD(P)+] n=1 Tax=Polycladomyces abyssicola TaxID=1125966 RepID=A0A8D5UGY7_9BACL|nr:NAD(P)H-dependent glycerol-3-phosphate dehydrogenase [Polycladomyces abyssicola]BCU81772.1 glycerol-3-phosphate dehydrogenase [NAD(P)+] [Polycladomyces abyssicola]